MSEGVGDTSLSLIERIRENDHDAWTRFIRIYGPVVFLWCVRRFRLREHDAHDVGQEVFVAVHANIQRVQLGTPGNTFRGWLWTVTRNKVYDWARRHPNMVNGLPLQRVPQPAPREDVLTNETSVCRRALEFIRPQFREKTFRAFWRTAVDGLTSPEVADELGMTPAAVRKARQRVKERLRRELDGLVDID